MTIRFLITAIILTIAAILPAQRHYPKGLTQPVCDTIQDIGSDEVILAPIHITADINDSDSILGFRWESKGGFDIDTFALVSDTLNIYRGDGVIVDSLFTDWRNYKSAPTVQRYKIYIDDTGHDLLYRPSPPPFFPLVIDGFLDVAETKSHSGNVSYIYMSSKEIPSGLCGGMSNVPMLADCYETPGNIYFITFSRLLSLEQSREMARMVGMTFFAPHKK